MYLFISLCCRSDEILLTKLICFYFYLFILPRVKSLASGMVAFWSHFSVRFVLLWDFLWYFDKVPNTFDISNEQWEFKK